MQIGSKGDDPGKLMFPYGIAVDSEDNIYVCDLGNSTSGLLVLRYSVQCSLNHFRSLSFQNFRFRTTYPKIMNFYWFCANSKLLFITAFLKSCFR